MKFDVIIIGGGHSGIQKGIALLKEGHTCMAVRRGDSSRRFREDGYVHRDQCNLFESLGGVILKGDKVVGGDFCPETGRLLRIYTANHGASAFVADTFYLATGSFFSGGLDSTKDKVFEPAFGLDVDYEGDHRSWVNPDFFGEQPFMKFGVKVDEDGCAVKDGKSVPNLFPIGSIVSKRK